MAEDVLISLVKMLAEMHRDEFFKIKNYFDYVAENWTYPEKLEATFIAEMIGDYVYDFSIAMLDDPINELEQYYDGDIRIFLRQVLEASKNPQNCVINTFLVFHENRKNLQEYKPSEIADISLDYRMTGDMCEYKDISFLPEKDRERLKRYLLGCGLSLPQT